jgi:hypothetical protein
MKLNHCVGSVLFITLTLSPVNGQHPSQEKMLLET